MSDIYETTSELASLWPALAAALARDTASGEPGPHTWTAATLVNADVLGAMLTLDREIPAAHRHACELLGERWQPRDHETSLRALPRFASRLDVTGHLREARLLEREAAGWLRVTKRALGLRKPDVPLGYACPYAQDRPEDHTAGRMLLMAGAEGCLREGPDGLRVEWAAKERIYCASEDCGASWSALHEWALLGKMLGTPSMAGAS